MMRAMLLPCLRAPAQALLATPRCIHEYIVTMNMRVMSALRWRGLVVGALRVI